MDMQNAPQRTLTICAAISSLSDRYGLTLIEQDRQTVDAIVQNCERRLSPSAFRQYWAAGAGVDDDHVVDLQAARTLISELSGV